MELCLQERTNVFLKKSGTINPPGFMVLMTTTFLILFRIGAGCWSIQIFHILGGIHINQELDGGCAGFGGSAT